MESVVFADTPVAQYLEGESMWCKLSIRVKAEVNDQVKVRPEMHWLLRTLPASQPYLPQRHHLRLKAYTDNTAELVGGHPVSSWRGRP